MGKEISVLQDKIVPEICCTKMWMYLILWNCNLKIIKMVNSALCFLPQLKINKQKSLGWALIMNYYTSVMNEWAKQWIQTNINYNEKTKW